MKSPAVPQTPFGIPPNILLAYYVFVCILSGNLISSTEPLKDLLRMRGVFSHLDPTEQEIWFCDVTSVGASFSILSAVFGGLLNDFCGPRMTAMLGQLVSATGFLLIFFSPIDNKTCYYIGLCLLGFTYACVSISHTVAAVLFPNCPTFAITVLCVGNDLSLSIPSRLQFFAIKLGNLQSVILGYVFINLTILCFEFFLVPANGFTPLQESKPTQLSDKSSSSQTCKPQNYSSMSVSSLEVTDPVSGTDCCESLPMDRWPLYKQLASWHYAVITIYICFSFFRKNHYAQLVRHINLEVAGRNVKDALFITDYYSFFLPLTMIPSFLTGVFTNRFGIFAGMMLLNTYAVLLYFVSSIPILAFQWFAILFFDCFAGFIFGLMYAYLGAFFGFSTLGTLQGFLKVFCGGIGLMFPLWQRYVVNKLPNLLWSNRILLAGSLLTYLLPLVLLWKGTPQMSTLSSEVSVPGRPSKKLVLGTLSGRPHSCVTECRVKSTVCMTGAEFGKASIAAIATETEIKARKLISDQKALLL